MKRIKVFVLFLIFIFLIIIFGCSPSETRETTKKDEKCLICHRKYSKFQVILWEKSKHKENGVGCTACHGINHREMKRLKGRVLPKKCAGCHEKEFADWQRSRHSLGLNLARANLRYKLQSFEVQKLGCEACHSIQERCDVCHSAHQFKKPKPPLTVTSGCENCHMGQDHPQKEAYDSSVHRRIAQESGKPTCSNCHGNHKVTKKRSEIIKACSECHTRKFAQDYLLKCDKIKRESIALLEEGRRIIQDLYKEGYLKEVPGSKLEHGIPPLSGKTLAYEETSFIEQVFFQMLKYDFSNITQGYYHISPDYGHWYGTARLKSHLAQLKSEAQKVKALRKKEAK